LHERRIGVRPQLPQRFAHDLPELVVGDFHLNKTVNGLSRSSG
jgi:hypothetical protein